MGCGEKILPSMIFRSGEISGLKARFLYFLLSYIILHCLSIFSDKSIFPDMSSLFGQGLPLLKLFFYNMDLING